MVCRCVCRNAAALLMVSDSHVNGASFAVLFIVTTEKLKLSKSPRRSQPAIEVKPTFSGRQVSPGAAVPYVD